MEIDTNKVTQRVGNAFAGILGMSLGQKSVGWSRKFLLLPGFGLVLWKLPAIVASPAFHDFMVLAMVYVAGQSLVDAAKAYGEAKSAQSAGQVTKVG